MCLAQGHNAVMPMRLELAGPSVSSQALYPWANALPMPGYNSMDQKTDNKMVILQKNSDSEQSEMVTWSWSKLFDTPVFMSHQPGVWGDILLLVRIPLASTDTFIYVHHLLNQLIDFDQTCIGRGGGEELIRFWWPWPDFQGHRGTLKCPKYGFRVLSSELVDGFWPNLHRYIVGSRVRVD